MAQPAVKLAEDVHELLKHRSEESGVPISRIVDRALRAELSAKPRKELK